MGFETLKKPPVALLGIFLLTFAAYAFAVQGTFKTMDDEVSIVRNEDIRSFANIGKLFTSSFFGDKSYHRPMIMVSFMAEYHLWGLNAMLYYVTNILLHAANAALVFAILRLVLGRAEAALFGALLFAIHPVQWEAVSNIPGRSNLLCGFFYLSAFWAYLSAGRLWWKYGIALALFTLGLFSKESAGMLPALIIAYAFFFRSDRRPFLKSLIPVLPFIAVEAAYVFFRRHLGITEVFYWASIPGLFLGFMTFLRGVITYFRLFLLPVDLQFDRSREIYTSFSDPGLWLTLAFFAAGAVLVIASRRKLGPVALFLVCWFFIDLVPVSQIFASIGVQPGYISVAEHFLYTPTVPAMALAVLGLGKLLRLNREKKRVSPRVLRLGLAGLFAFYYLLTIQHNIYSSNEIAMFERTLAITPLNVRIRNSLATSYARLGNYIESEKHFRKTLEDFPLNAWARIGLGKALCDQGKYWECVLEYEKVQDPGKFQELLDDNVHLTYGILLREQQKKLQADPLNSQLHYGLGIVYSKTGDFPGAMAEFEETVRLRPDFREGLFNLGSVYEAAGRLAEAAAVYERMLALGAPDDELTRHAYLHLAEIYGKLGDNDNAARYQGLAGGLVP
ncbi:MAG: tetratricopeptide repeat protein [Candidatus Omnitrophota bacterium]|nr:tetratricopeptide repeat protein [Candidatus Omnitrophota bacterium]MDZ4241640.1 tetratricopeptide repeat protein [Candidatus Omnitrophota bacterium]